MALNSCGGARFGLQEPAVALPRLLFDALTRARRRLSGVVAVEDVPRTYSAYRREAAGLIRHRDPPSKLSEEVVCLVCRHFSQREQREGGKNTEKLPELTHWHASEVLKRLPDAQSALSFFVWTLGRPRAGLVSPEMLAGVLSRRKVDLWALLRELRRPIPPDVFPALILCYGRLGMLKEATEVIHTMAEEFGCAATPDAFNALLKTLVEAGQYAQAETLHKKMGALGLSISGKVTLNIMLLGLGKSGKVKKARSFLDTLHRSGNPPDSINYTALIRGLLLGGFLDDAISVFSDITKLDAVAYSTLMDGLTKAGRFTEAVELFSSMRMQGCRPNVFCYTILIRGYCNASDFRAALKLIEEDMPKHGCTPNAVTFNTLIAGLCKSGKLTRALALFEKCRANRWSPDQTTYNILIQGYSKAGLLDRAFSLFHAMLKAGLHPDAFTFHALVGGLCKVGRLGKAFQLCERMAKKGHPPSIRTYNSLLLGLLQSNKQEQAWDLLRGLEAEKCSFDSTTFNILINHLLKLEKTEEAFKLYSKMAPAGIRPNVVTFNTFLGGLVKLGMFDKADGVISEFSKYGLAADSITCRIVVDCFLMEGRTSASLALLDRLVEAGFGERIPIYAEIMHKLCVVEAPLKADALLDNMFRKGLMTSGPQEVDVFIQTISHSGNVSKCAEVIKQMLTRGCIPSAGVSNFVVHCLLREGSKESALVLGEMFIQHGLSVDSMLIKMAKRSHIPREMY